MAKRRAGGSRVANVKVQGAKELDRKLKALGRKLAGKIARKALRAGAKVIQARAKELAPKESGLLAKSIKVRAGKRNRKGIIRVVVQTGEGDFKGDQFYGAFIEFGFKKVPVYRKGNRFYSAPRGTEPRTEIPPQPFMRPAADEKAPEAAEVVRRELAAGIEEAAKELA